MKSIAFLLVVTLLIRIGRSEEWNAQYDTLSRTLKYENQKGFSIAYTYDASGNILSRTVIDERRSIQAAVDPPGSGTVSGVGIYRVGSTATLTAVPASLFEHESWSEAGASVAAVATYTFTVSDDRNLTALFKAIAPPSIVAPPSSLTVSSGETVRLTIDATGSSLAYQWLRNGQPIDGATSPTLDLPRATWNEAGSYTVEVTNPAGTRRTDPVILGVALTGYGEWKNTVFSPTELAANDPALVGPDAAPDDGITTNFLRYLLGIGPRDPVTRALTHMEAAGDPGESRFAFHRLLRGGGLTYRVDVSRDLAQWDTSQTQIEPVGPPIHNPDGRTEKWVYRIKEAPLSARAFFKLYVSGPTERTLLSDDFNDNAIDPARWSTEKVRVVEENAIMNILTEQTDNGGTLMSQPVAMNPTGEIVITRRVKVHAANDYTIPIFALDFGGLPRCAVQYGKMQYAGAPHRALHGIVISRNDTSPHMRGTEADTSETVPVPWDEWFDEKIVYSPVTGLLSYSINGTEKIAFNVGVMPTSTNPTFTMRANAWGWWTGHSHLFDDLVVRQLSPTP